MTLEWEQKKYYAHVTCPTGEKSGHMYYLENDDYKKYFLGESINCNWCKKEIDLWAGLEATLERGTVFCAHYTLLGCVESSAKLIIEPRKMFDLDFSEQIGDGKILYLNYTIDGSAGERTLYPLEWTSTEPLKEINRNKRLIIPYDYFKNDAVATEINVHYCYAPSNVFNDLSTSLLLDAFEYFYNKEYEHMIVSAQTAIEILQNEFLSACFEKTEISASKTREFLSQNATFYSQIFILLKWITKNMNKPYLNEKILKNIERLIKTRNKIIHTGQVKSNWSEKDYQEMLISAFLVYKYYKVMNEI